ncbi:MAG: N-methyl-L-tryptophan oxidase [Roseiflexaceae bacterium]
MNNAYDAIVIGAGVMGCATAYHLARDGRRDMLLEQFALGHQRGSSHGRARIFRLTYARPEYVELARAALPLWRALEAEAGERLLLPTGGLQFGAPGEPGLAALRATLTTMGVPFEPLDRQAIAERFPQFDLPPETVGLYQADTALLDADRCVAALAAVARRHGAEIREGVAATRIAADGDGVEVATQHEVFRADRLVVAAGSWVGGLLRQVGLDLPLTVTKEQFAYFAVRAPALFEVGRFPIFIHHGDAPDGGYGFPSYGLPGVRVAWHHGGPPIAPEDVGDVVDEQALAALRAYVMRLLPGATGEVLHAQTCRYTTTPDTHFILDRHPAHPQIVIASPCSGHGFKFGALIGRIAADLAQHGATDHPIGMFRVDRWAERITTRWTTSTS